MKKRKLETSESIELPNQENTRVPGEYDTYKYLRFLVADTIKSIEMKEEIEKNTRTVSLIKYSGPFIS